MDQKYQIQPLSASPELKTQTYFFPAKMKPKPAGNILSYLWWKRSAHEILPNLWVGGVTAAEDVEQLRTNRIALVMTIRDGYVSTKVRKAYHESNITHARANKKDIEEEDLYSIFVKTGNIIAESLQKGEGVLVHCTLGVSRSVTIVVAYLMQSQKLKPWTALCLVQERRHVACPNTGFRKQLEKWDAELEASRKALQRVPKLQIKEDLGAVPNTVLHAPEQPGALPKSGEDSPPVLGTSKACTPPSSSSPLIKQSQQMARQAGRDEGRGQP